MVELKCPRFISMISKSQIDKLGDRLRQGRGTEDDLRLLDEYRRSFSEAYELVVGAIRSKLNLEPTGRPAKSTTAISEKLQRESIRLTQIQDIAGCRLVIDNILDQERVVRDLEMLFTSTLTVDRRANPSHGYRAVHVIVRGGSKTVEIQVRTRLQHVWADLSEKFSDIVHPMIKYGGGEERIVKVLLETSQVIAGEEFNETAIEKLELEIARTVSNKDYAPDKEQDVLRLQTEIGSLKQRHVQEREKNLTTLKTIVDTLED